MCAINQAMNDAKRTTIGRAILAMREENGWTLRDASDATGLDPGHLSRIERGEHSMTMETLQKVAEGYDVTVTEIFQRAEELK